MKKKKNLLEKSDLITVPDLRGIQLKNVYTYLEKIGLKTGDVYLDEAKAPNNMIINQSIKPGKEVKKGTAINLTISNINPIRFLPSIYSKEDSKNNDYLRRYLWIFQHITNSFSNKLNEIHNYFNPMKAPKEFFLWLASWFSINTNFAIPEDKMRLLVKEAVYLYQWRGTAIGLSKFLEIITGIKPDIIENYIPISEYVIQDNKVVERTILKEMTTPYYFTVKFPVKSNYFDLETIKKIHDLIKTEKPAHTSYYVTFVPAAPKKKKKGFIIGETTTGEI